MNVLRDPLSGVSALFTTFLELPVFWRNLWLAICITFAVLMWLGVLFLET